MIAWENHADAIIARLKATVPDLATVLHVKEAETDSKPATMPAAYLVMAQTVFASSGNFRTSVMVTWQVLVRCKSMAGYTGALEIADQVVDALTGYRITAGIEPLAPVSAEFFREEMRPEPAYVLTFTTTTDQLPSPSTC